MVFTLFWCKSYTILVLWDGDGLKDYGKHLEATPRSHDQKNLLEILHCSTTVLCNFSLVVDEQ